MRFFSSLKSAVTQPPPPALILRSTFASLSNVSWHKPRTVKSITSYTFEIGPFSHCFSLVRNVCISAFVFLVRDSCSSNSSINRFYPSLNSSSPRSPATEGNGKSLDSDLPSTLREKRLTRFLSSVYEHCIPGSYATPRTISSSLPYEKVPWSARLPVDNYEVLYATTFEVSQRYRKKLKVKF